MGGLSRRRIGAVAVTGLVVAGVAAFSSISASGQTPPLASGPVLVPYGTLTINLSSTPESFELRDPSGEIMMTEFIDTVQPCATIIEGSGELLNLSPTSPGSDTVQIRNAAFGVNTGNTSCGSSAAAVVSGSEKLTVDLGPELVAAGVSARSASLQITQVKRGNLNVVLDGVPFLTNENISTSPQQVSVDPTINAAGDLFTSIALTSTSNKDNEGISLAGGTTFDLVTLDPNFDVAVDCGESVPASSTTGVATSATYLRLDNKVEGNTCLEVGVKVEIQGPNGPTGRVFWNNSFTPVNGGPEQTVQAYFTIVWAPTADLGKLNRVIDYDGDGTAQSSPVPMQWCAAEDPAVPGFPTLPASPTPGIGINVADAGDPADWRAPWCLVNDDRALQTDGTIVQTQKLFGSGDPWAR